jgi:hypothetical protein
MVRQPLGSRHVALSAIEDRFHQWIAAGHHVADDPQVRLDRNLIFAKSLGELNAERGKLLGLMQHAESHIGQLTSELERLHASVDSFNETVISVPIEVLRLARTQFDVLSAGFARKGDVISQAMSEIGGFAIDQALTVKKADPA